LQARYQGRLSQGLQTLINYTWSRAIDEVSNELTQGVLDPGPADFDVRHNFSAAASYNIPEFKAISFLRPVLRDWSVDLIVFAQSGKPINIFMGGTFIRPDGTTYQVRPDVVPGAPFWIEDRGVPGGRRLNIAAFAPPPSPPAGSYLAQQGTLGRNAVRLPGFHQLNMALGRRIALRDNVSLQLKAEVFNVLNHPLFGQYDNFYSRTSTTFGIPSDTLNRSLGGLSSLYQSGGPRSMQLSAKISF
jgi:hypothetical protein